MMNCIKEPNPFTIFLACLFVFIILCIIAGIKNSSDAKKKEHEMWFNSLQKQFDKHYDSIALAKNYKTAQNHLSSAKTLFNVNKNLMWQAEIEYFEYDLAEMQTMTDDLVNDFFDDLARMKASAFFDSFYNFTVYIKDENPTFKTIGRAKDESKKCLKLYDSFFDIWRMEDCPQIDMCAILKEEADDCYMPCLDKRSDFVNYLDNCIAKINPELQRKKQLLKMIIDVVRSEDRIGRSKLLNKQYDGFSKKEVSYCYKELLEKRRLIEYKPYGEYIVVLGEKERSDKQGQTGNKIPMEKAIIERQEVISTVKTDRIKKSRSNKKKKYRFDTVEQFIDALADQGIQYVDKRKQGGCLWVISTDMSDKYLNNVIILGYRIKKVASSRALKGGPGWFVKETGRRGEISNNDDSPDYDNEVVLIQRF